MFAPRAPGLHRGAHGDEQRLRGLLAEFGFVLPQRATEVRRHADASLDRLPVHAACAIRDLREHLRVLDTRVKEYQRSIEAHAREHYGAKLAQQRQGIGPMTASAIGASVGDVREFKNGRQFSAWLGLVPRQHSTGGSNGSGISRGVAILTYERCLLWALGACCSERVASPIHCPVGRSPCACAAATTVLASLSPPTTRGRMGDAQSARVRLIAQRSK